MTTSRVWRGHVNRFTPPDTFGGWAVDMQNADNANLEATVRLRGQPIGSVKANLHQPYLEQFGNGNFGFEIVCTEPVPFPAIYSGEVDILITDGPVEYGTLSVDWEIQLFARMLEASRLITDLSNFDQRMLRIMLNLITTHVPGPAVNAMGSVLTLIKSDRSLLPDTVAAFDGSQVSGLFFRTGIVSSDQSAMIGRDGHLFLIEGSNNVLDIFARPYGNDASAALTERWIALIKSRKSAVEAVGARFIQIVIPDKIAITRELLDGSLSYPTATLAALETRAASEIPSGCYLSGLTVLAALPFATAFRKIDTHLTPRGAFAIFAEICAMLGRRLATTVPFDLPYLTSGDLAQRFFGHPLYEVSYAAHEPAFASGRSVITERHPPQGRHIGMRQVFRNELAPIKLKAIVFGNSFFAGHVLQGSINYWMSIWFQDYHFVASPEMDTAYIERERPDVVLCQTIERFLDTVPQT